MTVDLIVKNVRLPIKGELKEANLLVDEEKIIEVSRRTTRSDSVYDGKGNILLPGMIDTHVHLRDPDENPAEDFTSGTQAAAHGGVTTIADMPNTKPAVVDEKKFSSKRNMALKKSLIDFALIGGLGETTFENARELEEAGAVAVKTFMTSRFPALAAPHTGVIKNIMENASQTSLPLMIHAEDLGVVEHREAVKPIDHCLLRSTGVESVAVARICELARQTDTKTHFVHLSSKASVEIIKVFKRLGANITGETCSRYLTLTMEEMRRRGPYAKVDPPLRTSEDIRALRSAIRNGTLELIASDHAPYPKEEKERGFEKIGLAPSGVPEVEITLPCLFDLFLRGEFTLEDILKALCTNPAKFLGLYPRKGTLQPGADADFVILDPNQEFEVKEDRLLTKTRETAFMGKTFSATPTATFSRGELIVKNHEILGDPGRGGFLTRSDKDSASEN